MDDPRPPHVGSPVAEELRTARPSVDRVEMEAVRARAEQRLFGTDAPAKLGRYVVLDRIAGGGMGVVYRGYDPELHRKVALKVLHPRQHEDDRAHARLLAEARALARLDHANVVRIHDVLAESKDIVLVMELVEGDTLAAWERNARRSWREVVSAYAQAARGLAAAHELGIVHRDFKPANAIIGSDDRVRVLDFGLALARDEAPATPLASGSAGEDHRAADGLTATGEVLGTLGYSSPEQLSGDVATPASDQFSLCVSLYRALEGIPPFVGMDPTELVASIRAGRLARAAGDRGVPGWLRVLVVRGLAAEPSARFESMAVLAHELTRTRGWRRWRMPIVATAGVAAFAAMAFHGAEPASAPSCDGGTSEIAADWNETRRASVLATLQQANALSPADAERVLTRLDAYRDRWIELHRDACVDHRRGVHSAALLDRRVTCLARRRSDFATSVSVLASADLPAARKAVDVVTGLPSLDACGDLEGLQAETPPPPPGLRVQVDAVRQKLGLSATLERAGRSKEALATVTQALADARVTGHTPAVAEAALARGALLLLQRDFVEAVPQLGEARDLALRDRLFPIAVEAAARALYAAQFEKADRSALESTASFFEPLADGLPSSSAARPLLLNNIGASYMAVGDRDEARMYFERARKARPDVLASDLELMIIELNLAMVTPDDVEREHLALDGWQRRQKVLGDLHLLTIQAQDMYARYLRAPDLALGVLTDVCEAYAAAHTELIEQRVHCEAYRAFLTEHLGDAKRAAEIYASAAQLGEGNTNPDVSSWTALALGESQRLAGDHSAAAKTFEAVLARDADAAEIWILVRAANAHLGLGRLFSARGNRPAALRHLEAAEAIYSDFTTVSRETEIQLRLASAERLRSNPTTAQP